MEIELSSGNYLNGKTCEAGDVIEFLNEGEQAEITLKDGSKKNVYNFRVSVNEEKELIYTPNTRALALFISEWGKNSKDWIGKTFTIKKVMMEVRGEEIEVIRPIIATEEAVK